MWKTFLTILALSLFLDEATVSTHLALGATPAQRVVPARNLEKSIVSGGRRRTYSIHIPPLTRIRTTNRPLLIVLHGSYGSGEKMQRALGFDRYSNQKGFLVAYPNAYRRYRWNDGRDTLSSGNQSVNDVQFLVDLVNRIKRDHAIDSSRVYVTGASNGAMMAYRLACETDSVFAGFAPVIGNLPLSISASCNPSAPSNFLAINGDADPIVPYEGGEVCQGISPRFCEHGDVLSTDDSVAKLAVANQCSSSELITRAPRVDDGTYVEELRFGGCATSSQVRAVTVRNGGHTWPPFPGQLPISGAQTRNLNATREIVGFFFN